MVWEEDVVLCYHHGQREEEEDWEEEVRWVLYHQLHPQQKITTMRVKLYARVRTYDDASDKWSMRVISLPTELTDWWHIRLHFKEIDGGSI